MDYNDILMHHYSSNDFLCHHGILGQKWGIRRFQNPDGTLTAAGRKRYLKGDGSLTKAGKKEYDKIQKEFYKELENDPNGQALDKKIRELIASNSEIKNMSENWDGDGFEFIEAVKEAETLSPKDRDELLDLDRKTNDAVWAMNNKLDERIAKLYGKWQPEPTKEKQKTSIVDRVTFDKTTDGMYQGMLTKSTYGNGHPWLTYRKPEDKELLDRVLKDNDLESVMRNSAAENLYRLNHKNASEEDYERDKEEYAKKLSCLQLSANADSKKNDSGFKSLITAWYTNPDEYGEWYMEVDPDHRKIGFSQRF